MTASSTIRERGGCECVLHGYRTTPTRFQVPDPSDPSDYGSVTTRVLLRFPSSAWKDLEHNKPAAGRFQDLADVEALRRNR